MAAWSEARIDECCQIVSGATPSTGNPAYWGGDICWATPKDLSGLQGPYISDTPRKITPAGLASCAAEILPAGSVLLSSRAPIGHVAINTVPMATNQGFKSLVPDRGRLDAKFLYWWLKANRAYLETLGNGATFKEVSKAVVSRVRLPLPPLGEQRRIAEVLDRAEALRAKRRAATAKVDELQRAIFVDYFGDPLINPRGWRTAPLGELARIIRGASPRPAGDPRYFGGPIPWLKISDVTASAGRVITRIKEGVTEAGRDRSVYLEPGTLILTNSATVGIPKFLGVGSCIHDGFLAFLDIDQRVKPEFLYMFFLHMREHISALAPEGTQKNLNTGIVKALPLMLPPIELQERFKRALTLLDEMEVALRSALRSVDVLFASLQYRAFSGQL